MNNITLTEMDYLRLNSLVEKNEFALEIEELETEVESARILDFPEIPSDLITMNTVFRYHNLTDDKIEVMKIVYPHHSNSEEKKISVLAPLGTAFLGLREDDEIQWTFPDGKVKKLKVLEVLYQPEANGDLHL